MYRGGYAGKILRINLTDQSVKEEELPEELAQNYIGGAGFGIKILYDELKPKTAPLSPENKIIWAVGPLTATGVASTSRMAVVAKSPLTEALGMALTGGHFPAELKMAGYDVVIIEGKADKLTYISIKDGQVKFRSAEKFAGMCTTDTQLFVKDDLHDQNYRVACIGPAGEKLGIMACIINERRAIGRKGLGAVMGSKNLKAIAVRGTKRPAIADAEKFKEARKALNQGLKNSPVTYPLFANIGTPLVVDTTNEKGIYPARNWMSTGEEDYTPIHGIEAQAKMIVTKNYCFDCPVGCSQVKLVKEGPFAGFLSEGPEYETIYSLGSTVGVKDLSAIIAGDRICDEYGVDTISAGVTIGMAMELYEKGILTRDDCDGLELKFGDAMQVMDLLRRLSFQEGKLGKLLSLGSKKAALKIGKNAIDYAIQIKGLELPAYDVRGAKSHGLNMATAYTGADHNRGYAFQEIFDVPIPEPYDRMEIKGKGKLTMWNQDSRSVCCDCATQCAFLLDQALPPPFTGCTAALVTGATGLEFDTDSAQQVGERMNNVARLFNIQEGFTRKDDTFPKRLMTEAIKAGASKGAIITQKDLDFMLDEYYEARGWDKDGVPTEAKLKELGITRH